MSSPTVQSGANVGRVTQVIGSTLDAKFDEARMPTLYNALKVPIERKVLGRTEARHAVVRSGPAPGRRRRAAPWPWAPPTASAAAWNRGHRRSRSPCPSALKPSAASSTSSANPSTSAAPSTPESAAPSTTIPPLFTNLDPKIRDA